MKKISLLLLLLVICLGVKAQEPRFIFPDRTDSVAVVGKQAPKKALSDSIAHDSIHTPNIYAWKIDTRYGTQRLVDRDSLLYNFHQSSLMDGKGISVGYLGNLGSPAQSKMFFERGEGSQFSFLNAFEYYYKKPSDQYFLNTKEPYSNFTYFSGGGKQSKEEELKAELSFNVNKSLNVGFNIDYVYSRGFYSNLSNKQYNYNLFASYLTDKLEIHAFGGNNYFANSENGGILGDSLLGVKPSVPSLDLPVAMESVWNKVRGKQLFATGKYNIGYHNEDSTAFIPVASLIYTTNYADQRRRFTARQNARIDKSIYDSNLEFREAVDDNTAYWSFKNTFAIALNEGFKDWVKFGLKLFVEQDFRKYLVPDFEEPMFGRVASQSSTVIGGALTKSKGRYLKYDLSADIGVTGYNLGEFRVNGDISTVIPFRGKDAIVRANAYIKNLKPTFFENNYMSRYHYNWSNDFGDIKRVYLGGEIIIPHTKTKLSGGVENIDNYIYYGTDRKPAQEGSNIQVVALRIDQKLNAGILHWDNQIAFQTSSKESVLPLPKLNLYTNIYLQTKIAQVLTVQLGVDAHIHSKYYAPGYDPLTLQFYNQRDVKIGAFPITTVYANLHLKKTRFFVMMYNVAGSMGDSDYFSLPHYPVNPMIMKFGLSWDFNN